MAKTIVKHWVGSSTKQTNTDFKEFPSKKEAAEYIKSMRRHQKIRGSETDGVSNFYEVYKKTT